MNKYKILSGFKILKDSYHKYITDISNNSKNVKNGSLFIAVKGTKSDGHLFLEEAIKNGAYSVLIEDKRYFKKLKNYNVTVALSEDNRKAQGIVASRFYNKPSEKLKIIGVTGTNGKTTVSSLIYQYLTLYGKNTGLIGTIWYKYKDYIFDAGRTTPDSIHLNKILNKMLTKGAQYISMEVSSHAAHQNRIYGLKYEGGIFTNLTQDHLDYHKTMEDYFLAKKRFFDYTLQTNKDAVFSVNIDDEYGKRLYNELKNKANVVSYGKESKDFKILEVKTLLEGSHFTVNFKGKKIKLFSSLRGDFNIYNIAAAFSFLAEYGVDLEFLKEATQKLKPIRGRFEIVYSKDFLVVNDYAHTPDALENILKSINRLKKEE
jgi:UDP-N-acetylmuramoyl-L-alanyl-D-glutamate--2,6-diaminopimelate ligase